VAEALRGVVLMDCGSFLGGNFENTLQSKKIFPLGRKFSSKFWRE
jgi:hypothetical protein